MDDEDSELDSQEENQLAKIEYGRYHVGTPKPEIDFTVKVKNLILGNYIKK